MSTLPYKVSVDTLFVGWHLQNYKKIIKLPSIYATKHIFLHNPSCITLYSLCEPPDQPKINIALYSASQQHL